jgi:hypothetical protein
MASEFTYEDSLNDSIYDEGIAGGIIAQLCGNGLVLDDWKGYYFSSNCTKFIDQFGKFKIIKKVLTSDELKPNLVAMAGFSEKSFCASTRVIVNNLDKIQDMFNCVYVICFDEQVFKKYQTETCGIRDARKEKEDEIRANKGALTKEISLLRKLTPEEVIKEKEVYNEIYQSETELNEILGTVIDKLIRCARIGNVHLLGKCAGGGLAIHTFTKSNIYKALYLAVPASPTNVEHLRNTNLEGKKIIIAWDKRDEYPFHWDSKSNQELVSYERTLKALSADYIVAEFNEGESHPKDYHEIPDQLFDLIKENI